MNQKQPHLPIGYWLKQADNALTHHINTVQRSNGVSRAEWQVLNLLNDVGSANNDRILEFMQVFVDRAGFEAIVARLAEQGWIEQSQAEDQSELPFQLTAEGRQRHSQILAAQQAARRQAMLGISNEEYAAAVRVLQQIVRNLSESGVDLSPSDQ